MRRPDSPWSPPISREGAATATITRFDPFREFDRILSEGLRGSAPSTSLPIDLYKDGDRFVGLIDMPGVDPATIDIDVEDRTLTVRAERRSPVDGDARWLMHERPKGTYARQFALGKGLATDKIEADYTDGVLRLVIPVAEEAQPRKISVSCGSQHSEQSELVEGTAEDAA